MNTVLDDTLRKFDWSPKVWVETAACGVQTYDMPTGRTSVPAPRPAARL